MAYLYLCFAGDQGHRDQAGARVTTRPQWLTEFAQRLFHSLPWGENPNRMVLSGSCRHTVPAFSVARSQCQFPPPSLSRSVEQGFPVRSHHHRRSAFGPGSKRVIRVAKRSCRQIERLKYENFELAPLDRFKLSEISCVDTPFHLINTALNIQGSKYANRRGRNADFFVFSPKFIGSSATQYVRTEEFEDESKSSTWPRPWRSREPQRRRTWAPAASRR